MYPRGRYNDALKHLFRRGGKRINIIDTNLSPFFSVEYSFCISVKLEKKSKVTGKALTFLDLSSDIRGCTGEFVTSARARRAIQMNDKVRRVILHARHFKSLIYTCIRGERTLCF